MKKLFKYCIALTTLSMIASAYAPAAFAATTIKIKGNGNGSKNGVALINIKASLARQTNITNTGVTANPGSTTGNITITGTTGDGVTALTGLSTAGTTVQAGGDANILIPDGCGCDVDMGDITVKIKNNGANSLNGVLIGSLNIRALSQSNTANTGITATANASSGDIIVRDTTDGSVTATTGDSDSTVGVTIDPSSNIYGPLMP